MFRIILIILLLVCPAAAMDWNGIYPLRSTREQVVTVLGKPIGKISDFGERFRYNEEEIVILWTPKDCFSESARSIGSNADSLVKRMTVIPNKPIPMERFDSMIEANPIFFDENKILRPQMQSIDCWGRGCGVRDNGIGFGYDVSKFGVDKIYYFAPDEEWEKWKVGRVPCTDK
jgi:hypothetical protein